MAAAPLHPILRHLRRLAAGPLAGRSDRELLDLYARTRDETAFESLVRRHGPAVWGVCTRQLRDPNAAEDAFQAAFCALARQARSIRRPESLGCWLHGVALRCARKLAARPSIRLPVPPPTMVADVADTISARELQAALDEELDRLPERLRAPLVLCYLEERTRDEAAVRLGWSLGTLKRRLEQGRNVLRARLERRGVGLSVVLLAAETLCPTMPAGLSSATAQAAMTFAVGGLAGSVPATVAEAVLSATLTAKLRTTIVLLLAGSLVAAAGWTRQTGPDKATPQHGASVPRPAAEVPPLMEHGPPRLDRYGDPLPPGAIARLGTVRLRHGGRDYLWAKFSPDGRSLITGNGHSVRRWDAETGKLTWDFQSETYILSYALAPDGRAVAITEHSGLALIDAANGRKLKAMPANVTRYFDQLTYSPDGRRLARVTGEELTDIEIWNPDDGTRVGVLSVEKNTFPRIAYAPDGKTLIVLRTAGRMRYQFDHWDIVTAKIKHTAVLDIQSPGGTLSRDGRFFATRDIPSLRGRLWDTTTGKQLMELDDDMNLLKFLGDGRRLMEIHYGKDGGDNVLTLWDIETQKRLRKYDLPWRVGTTIEFAADGRTFLTAGQYAVFLWDAESGRRKLDFSAHEGGIAGLAFTPDRSTLVTAGDTTVRQWDQLTGDPWGVTNIPGRGIGNLALMPDGKSILVGGQGLPRLFDLGTGTERLRFAAAVEIPFKTVDGSQTTGLAATADGRTVIGTVWVRDERPDAAPSGTHLHFWDARTGRPTSSRPLPEPSETQLLAIAPDGTRMVLAQTVAADGTPRRDQKQAKEEDPTPPNAWRSVVSVVDARNGCPLVTLRQPEHEVSHAVFSADGQTLATISASSVQRGTGSEVSVLMARLWEVRTGRERVALPLRLARQDNWEVSGLSFSQSGRVLVIARHTRPGRLQFFDTVTGQELPGRTGFDTSARYFAFRRDDQVLATGHDDGTALVWDIAGIVPADRAPVRLDAAAPEARWADLAGDDARKAHAVIGELATAPTQAVEFLATRLRPAEAVPAEPLRQWIAELGHDQLRVRQAAECELAQHPDQAEPALRAALRGNVNAEQRQRIEALLSAPPVPPAGDALRSLRAVEVLERIGTPEARRVLARLAEGALAARLTTEATAALDRLDHATGRR